jgi:hypothetical protein
MMRLSLQADTLPNEEFTKLLDLPEDVLGVKKHVRHSEGFLRKNLGAVIVREVAVK